MFKRAMLASVSPRSIGYHAKFDQYQRVWYLA